MTNGFIVGFLVVYLIIFILICQRCANKIFPKFNGKFRKDQEDAIAAFLNEEPSGFQYS